MLARAAFGAALILFAELSGMPACAAGRGAYIEVHGIEVSWDGKAVGSYLSLETRCKALHRQTAGGQFTVASGIDTSDAQVRRVVKIIHQNCGGAHYIVYVASVRLNE